MKHQQLRGARPVQFTKAQRIIAIAGIVSASALVGGAAVAANEPTTVSACTSKSGAVRVLGASVTCKKREKKVTWGIQGPKGATGAAGATVPANGGAPGAQGSKGETGAQGPKGETGAQGPIGPAGEQGSDGAPGAVSWSGGVEVTLAADGAWHDIASFQLRTGTWDVEYYANLDPADGSSEYSPDLSGTVDCRVRVGGVTTAFTDTDGSRFGASMAWPAYSAPSSELIWSCRNALMRNGTDPVAMAGHVHVEQSTPDSVLAVVAL
jgi:hypothetical protein